MDKNRVDRRNPFLKLSSSLAPSGALLFQRPSFDGACIIQNHTMQIVFETREEIRVGWVS